MWQRIKAWFKRPSHFGSEKAVVKGAANLVERARQGDQVAIATLCEIRKAAARGVPKAKTAMRQVLNYVKAHPVTIGLDMDLPNPQCEEAILVLNSSLFGSDDDYVGALFTQLPVIGMEGAEKAAVVLSQGPDIYSETNARIRAIADRIENPQHKQVFCDALVNSGNSRELQRLMTSEAGANNALLIGYCVGIARRIQGVRLPETPVSLLSTMAGWELGE